MRNDDHAAEHTNTRNDDDHAIEGMNETSPTVGDVRDLRPLNEPTSNAKGRVSEEFLLQQQAVLRFIRDNIAEAVDRQKEYADRRGRKNNESFNEGERVLLSTENLPLKNISNLGANKLLPRFIGPFTVLSKKGNAYTIDIPSYLRLHPTFYVGRLKRYHPNAPTQERSVGRAASGAEEGSRYCSPVAPVGTRSQQTCVTAPTTRVVDAVAESRSPQTRVDFPRRTRGPVQLRHRAQPNELDPIPPEAHVEAPTDRHQSELEAEELEAEEHVETFDSLQRQRSPSVDEHSEAEDSHPRGVECDTVSRLRPRFERTKPPPLVDAEGQQRWIVDKIVTHRDVRAKSRSKKRCIYHREYRVRWLGYSESSDTWEPRSVLLDDIPDLVRDYEALLPANERA